MQMERRLQWRSLSQSLESSFGSVRQRLQDARQTIPTGSVAVEAIVTPQAINETQGPTLRKIEEEIRETLKRQLSSVRAPTWRRVQKHYMGRTRGWFPTKGEVDAKEFLGNQVEVCDDESGLAGASTTCAWGILRMVNQQLTAALASSTHNLRSPSEAREIGSSAHDIESSLERFQRRHDDSVKSFYAYISAPNSSDLLREHGFVGFDESGEQAVHADSIDALNCLGFTAISQSSENCKERLRLLRREEPEGLEASMDDDEETSLSDGGFGEGYRKVVINRVNFVCQQRVDEFLSSLSERLDHQVKEVGAERAGVASSKMRIWRARATLVGRFALVAFSFSALLFAFAEFAPSQFEVLLSVLPDGLFESVLIGALSTVFVLALVYIVTGAKNENVRWALRLVLMEKWTVRTKRRHLATALKAYFDESYNRLIADVDEMPLQVDHAIAEGVVEWLKNHSESHRQAEEALTELRQIIVARCEVFDEFIGVANQRLNEIPVELRETASGIKNNVIEEHMSRIRDAATSVENVKRDVDRVAKIATRSH